MGFDATEFLVGLFGGVSVAGPSTAGAVGEGGPPADSALDAGGFMDCAAEMPGAVVAMAGRDLDDETNEWLWRHIGDEDRQYLLGPVINDPPTEQQLRRYACWAQQRHPKPCPWCGGRLRHHPTCCSMTFEPEMPFGKYKGTRVSEVPEDYRRWLLASGMELNDELRAAVERRGGYARPVGSIETDG